MGKIETLRQKKAFEFYYILGNDRNCSKVSEEFQVSERTVYYWSKWYNWQVRVQERDLMNGQKLEEKTNETILEAKSKYLKIIKQTLQEYERALNSGSIKINSVQDLERLARLEMSLRVEEISEEDRRVNIIFKTKKPKLNLDEIS